MSQSDELTFPEPDPNTHSHSRTQTLDHLARRGTIFCPVTDHNPFDSQSYDSDWFSDLGSGSGRDVGNFLNDLFEEVGRSNDDDDDDLHAFDVPGSVSDPFSEFEFGNGGELGPDHEEDLQWLGFGVKLDFDTQRSGTDGLCIAGHDSESDRDTEFSSMDSNIRGDRFCLEEQGNGLEVLLPEGFEWEEVEDGVFNQRENLSIMVERVEEFSVASSEEEVEVRNLEWEILLGANMRLERELDGDSDSFLAAFQGESDADTAEFDAVFRRVVEIETGNPPAAKRFVENLPSVELTVEELLMNTVVCAICKDAIVVKEKVRRLPCSHYYHGDCIVPWLSIRNTCPVCRYELPTEDP
ncbi:E3 ubiquitin ligase BIG BROTHER-related-like [Juglans microcarpa x Juglans regia]|uniref:E3 ubiquitin ligase BIG BROTHER-related-like n=1 Tax=Juglans microcarpa x Juglans regia TaxID=2249226 RepID=UPI001B7F341D|nr:E3 ubiquitin ligase BIG BROTHER-related-like [Juglans microcarpa x Juglans regia]